VSDVSQGPGWWQASDGRWYPPQPAAPPPPAAPQWGGPPPAKKSNKGCFIALAIVGVVLLLGIGAVVAIVVAVGDEVDDRVDQVEQANRDGDIPTFSDNTENPPGDDVTVGECGPASDTGFMRATVDVLNHSSEPSNYLITVAFESDDGGEQYSTATTVVDGLGPDQTTTVEANTFEEPPVGQDFSCSINQVQRFAA
jgi:hypothetical protein